MKSHVPIVSVHIGIRRMRQQFSTGPVFPGMLKQQLKVVAIT